MDFFDVLTMIGGLALFLYGMDVMGDGLAKTSGGKLEKVLEKLTSSPIKAVLLGAGVTAVIQSSSATTVMVVGFVNSGIMKLSQAVGIIMGANIGTTVTSWILSLTGIESSNFFVQMLKPSSFSPILALIGIILMMTSKDSKKKDIASIMLGFAVLMFGMDTMSNAVKPLADVPEFTNILMIFTNPILGMIAGIILTAVIQSSSASVGILQALCSTGSMNYGIAFPIIMGQNIGTCVTAMISSIGAKKNAKRAALIHLYFNIIGTVLFMVVFYGINTFVNFSFLKDTANPMGIAVIHSIFNVVATLILLPFGNGLVKLATLTIRETEEEKEEAIPDATKLLDARFLEKPAFAVVQSKNVGIEMAKLAERALVQAIDAVTNYDKKKLKEVIKLEDMIDHYEDELGTYLMKLSGKPLSDEDNHTVSNLFHCMGDFERISDHALNLAESVMLMKDKEMEFSPKAAEELRIYGEAVKEIMGISVKAYETGDMELASNVEPLEEVIDDLNVKVRNQHVKRLRKGKCTIELGLSLSDILTDYERVADHCSNIAVCLIQAEEDGYETHEYLNKVKKKDNKEFQNLYQMYYNKYQIDKK
ncbi:MAG: Na/Pi cotransporter family protein [Lachnospiraceae bacterium]|nr:Na/Pi cotransporter family protein [Lachnospiraceae bacterium]MDD7378064.1 Na/Pi cotransporter family protein [Lachnospiraceae bacterium]MDY4617046.1 Na/Pi cotransporter family protein [Lachnospiraceae bacterium]